MARPSARERVRRIGQAAVGQLCRPVETGGGRARCVGGLGSAQRACRRDQRERIVERVAWCGDCGRRGGELIMCAWSGRAAPDRWARGQPRRGRGPGRCRRRCAAFVVRTEWRCRGRHVGRCVGTKRCRTKRDGGHDLRRFGRCRVRCGHRALRWRARRRIRLHRRNPHGAGRRRSVIRHAAGRVNRVCRPESRRRFICGDQPADDAERADAPADRVPRTPVVRAADARAGNSSRHDRGASRNRRRYRHGPWLPAARAVRPVDVNAGCRQRGETVPAGPRTGGAAKGPFAAERRNDIERRDARAGECAFDGDEGRWGHEGSTPCDTGNRAGRGAEMSSLIVTLWSGGESRSIRSIRFLLPIRDDSYEKRAATAMATVAAAQGKCRVGVA